MLELSRDESELRLCAGRGWPAALVGRYTTSPRGNTPAAFALRAGEPVLVRDFARETRFAASPHMRDDAVRSGMLLGFGGKTGVFGVFGVYSRQYRQFTRDDLNFFQAVANVLAAAIERRRAEEVVREAQQEAEKANLAKSEFLSRMSHELRTPLNAILGFGQLLELDPLAPLQAQSVNHILKAGRHLLTLIDEVLDIARIEAGKLDITLTPVTVASVLNDVLEFVRPLADQRSIRLDPPGQREMAGRHVLADEKLLRQVLLNLLSNAVKYNHPGGQVRVACEGPPGDAGWLRIAVSDTGPGIADEKLGRLFSPFERLGAEQSGIQGSGLGLALSKRLIEAQGGGIEAQSQVGEGSTFTVTVPLCGCPEPPAFLMPAVSASTATSLSAEALAHGVGDAAGEQRTVLYIEDNLSNLNLVESLLARQPGVRVLAARHGTAGLEMAARHQPDVILLDLHLPDISGEEVLRRLRSDPETDHIPVVVVSADAIPAQVKALLDAGARDYITKPLEVEQFMRVLQGCFAARKVSVACPVSP